MKRPSHNAGFTSAEMLVATALAGIVIGAAALAYHTLLMGQRSFTETVQVNIPAAAQNNFYGVNSSSITSYVAPNFGCVARAEAMRARFAADTLQAVGVFCLYRNTGVYNTIRPSTIPAPSVTAKLDTVEAFRGHLNANVSGASSIFNINYRSYYDSPNYSIFVLGYSGDITNLPVIAVYDIDIVPATDSTGNTTLGQYASVRRYVAGTLTAYYDAIYLTANSTDQFSPPVVCFERAVRLAVAESSVDPFKKAAGQPFYFIWWPDPARDSLKVPNPNTSATFSTTSSTLNPTFSSTDPRKIYNHMGGRTSYMFTVPMFPSG
jgi:hypothetical protein